MMSTSFFEEGNAMKTLFRSTIAVGVICLGLLAGCDPKPQAPKATELRQQSPAGAVAAAVTPTRAAG